MLQTTGRRGDASEAASERDAAAATSDLPGGRSIDRLARFACLFAGSIPLRAQLGALLLVVGASLTEGVGITLLAPLLALLSDSTTNAAPARMAELLNAVGLPVSLPLVLCIFVAAVVLRAAFVHQRDVAIFDLQYSFNDALRRRFYQAIGRAAWPFIARERLSHLLKALAGDVDAVGQGTFFFLRFPAMALVAAVQLAIGLSIAPALTVAVIACSGLIATAARFLRGNAYLAGKQLAQARRATFEEISDFLASLKLIKSHNAEEPHRLAFDLALARQKETAFAFTRRTTNAQALVQVGSATSLGAFVYAGATFAHLATPQLLIMIVIFARLLPVLMQIQQSAQSVWQMLPVFDDLYGLIARCEAAREPLVAGGKERLPLRDKIELSGVRFRYDKERGPDVLQGLDLTIEAGSVVAIVGASGAGKSTLADLLMGLLVPDAGNLSVDGASLADARLAAWRRGIAYVPQEDFLFNRSIRTNLQWAYPEASDDEIAHVLAQTGAAAVVHAMPEGLETIVGERGSRLSGGERQRLILARALLRDPTLLILDEATSALDHESECAVWAIIDRLRGSTTVIVIAHRLSTLRSADRIAVLDGGRIVQLGPWDALMHERDGRFALLVRAGAVMDDVAS